MAETYETTLAEHLKQSGAASVQDEQLATYLDEQDPLAPLAASFVLPDVAEICAVAAATPSPPGAPMPAPSPPPSRAIYFCGNSLGVVPRRSVTLLHEEIATWSARGVLGHFAHPHDRPWARYDDHVRASLARIVGAEPREVVAMNGLTVNLHLMLLSFYRPTAARYKIVIEAGAFPSDQFAVASAARFHGHDPAAAVVAVAPRAGEHTLREADILAAVAAPDVALVLFSGIQYYTGQCFPMAAIARHARAHGAMVGLDLAHAVGNVPLALHDWDVDFAVWCSYKYLNAGPGGIGGAFVHARHLEGAADGRADRALGHVGDDGTRLRRLEGWWGSDASRKFEMDGVFRAEPDAYAFRLSNPPIWQLATLLGSLAVFDQTSMAALRAKSVLLTGYLETRLRHLAAHPPPRAPRPPFTILTPSDPAQRGAQLSLLFHAGTMPRVAHGLMLHGVVCDERKPDVIRIAPTPLYGSFAEVWRFVDVLRAVLAEATTEPSA